MQFTITVIEIHLFIIIRIVISNTGGILTFIIIDKIHNTFKFPD